MVVSVPDFTVGLWSFQGPTYRRRIIMEGALTPGINVGYTVADANGALAQLPPGSNIPDGVDFGLLGGHLWLPGAIAAGSVELNRADRWAALFGTGSYKRLDA